MKICSKSDIGIVRNNNQDYYKIGHFSHDCAFAVVCDGMGGANGGGTASRVAVEFVSDRMEECSLNVLNGDIQDNMKSIVQKANKKVFDISKEDESLFGMGTTIVFAILDHDKLHLVHAGDSRAYKISNGKIAQVTKDHSIVQELIESGEITKEQAQTHPKKNVITRALGVYNDIDLDYFECDFNTGDELLICTDGLSNYLSEPELLSIVTEFEEQDAVEKLVSKANDRGGNDNITVILIKK